MGNAWLILPGKHSNFNDTSDKKILIFTACGITIKKRDGGLRGEQDQTSLHWLKLPVPMLWVPVARSSQNLYDVDPSFSTPRVSETCCWGQIPSHSESPAMAELCFGLPALANTLRRDKPLALVQCSQYLCCFKLSFSTQAACKIFFHSGATDILRYPWVLPLSCPFLFQAPPLLLCPFSPS